jgi:CheY-like chemotaxis protein
MPTAPRTPPSQPAAPLPRILLIDDEAPVLHTLQMLLEESGYAVTVARNGKDGVTAFRTVRPDLVLTDIIMPDQEGIETIMQIRRDSPDARIIAMSGGGRIGNSDFLAIASALGANATIAKPFDVDDLLILVERTLSERPAAEPAAA